MNKPLISVSNVTKIYKINQRVNGLPGQIANLLFPKYVDIKAVDQISFDINEGEVVGFIGPNGAGKSTIIKMLSGILFPSSGEIHVAGYVPYKQRQKYVSHIGVVFGQKSQLSWDLPVIDSFELLKHIYKIPNDLYKDNLTLFSNLLDMESFINQPVRQLSLGQRMRSDIAAALLHSPKLVFFDEPTIGLDVVAKERIREFIHHINKEQGVTMIFTSHDMQDIEKICHQLIIIDHGQKIFDGDISGFKNQFGAQRKLIVEFEQECEISDIKGVTIENMENHKKEFCFHGEDVQMKSLISSLINSYEVKDLTICEPEIETLVRQIYERGGHI